MTDVILVFALSFLLAWPLGRYLARVFKWDLALHTAVSFVPNTDQQSFIATHFHSSMD